MPNQEVFVKNIKIYLNRLNKKEFINELFPFIANLALRAPELFPNENFELLTQYKP